MHIHISGAANGKMERVPRRGILKKPEEEGEGSEDSYLYCNVPDHHEMVRQCRLAVGFSQFLFTPWQKIPEAIFRRNLFFHIYSCFFKVIGPVLPLRLPLKHSLLQLCIWPRTYTIIWYRWRFDVNAHAPVLISQSLQTTGALWRPVASDAT